MSYGEAQMAEGSSLGYANQAMVQTKAIEGPSIGGELKNTEQMLEELFSVLKVLEDRISPIMAHEPPCDVSKEPQGAFGIPVLDHIKDIQRKIRAITAFARTLNDRVRI